MDLVRLSIRARWRRSLASSLTIALLIGVAGGFVIAAAAAARAADGAYQVLLREVDAPDLILIPACGSRRLTGCSVSAEANDIEAQVDKLRRLDFVEQARDAETVRPYLLGLDGTVLLATAVGPGVVHGTGVSRDRSSSEMNSSTTSTPLGHRHELDGAVVDIQTDDGAAPCNHLAVLLDGTIGLAGRPNELADLAAGQVWSAATRDSRPVLAWGVGHPLVAGLFVGVVAAFAVDDPARELTAARFVAATASTGEPRTVPDIHAKLLAEAYDLWCLLYGGTSRQLVAGFAWSHYPSPYLDFGLAYVFQFPVVR